MILCLAISVEHRLVTNRQTDTRLWHIHASMASRGKNCQAFWHLGAMCVLSDGSKMEGGMYLCCFFIWCNSASINLKDPAESDSKVKYYSNSVLHNSVVCTYTASNLQLL